MCQPIKHSTIQMKQCCIYQSERNVAHTLTELQEISGVDNLQVSSQREYDMFRVIVIVILLFHFIKQNKIF